VRSTIGTLLELVGAVAVLAAAWAFDPLLGVALAGAVCIAAGYVVADPRRRKG
jgi:hypothetical protein